MKFKYLFLAFFISLFLVFAGCSSQPDCSKQDTKYIKYSLNPDTSKCSISEKIKKNVCGNSVIEDGETFCNCKADVSKLNPVVGCSGTTGDYLEKSCSTITNKCELTQNNKVVEQIKSIDFKSSDLTISGDFTLNTPFVLNILNKNTIKVKLYLSKISPNYKFSNILIKDLKIEKYDSTVLGSTNYGETLFNIDDSLSEKNIELKGTTKYLSREQLKLKLKISYTKKFSDSSGKIVKTENKIETLQSSLGRWEIINPNFFEDKKK